VLRVPPRERGWDLQLFFANISSFGVHGPISTPGSLLIVLVRMSSVIQVQGFCVAQRCGFKYLALDYSDGATGSTQLNQLAGGRYDARRGRLPLFLAERSHPRQDDRSFSFFQISSAI
jgi:hypothetical protein